MMITLNKYIQHLENETISILLTKPPFHSIIIKRKEKKVAIITHVLVNKQTNKMPFKSATKFGLKLCFVIFLLLRLKQA